MDVYVEYFEFLNELRDSGVTNMFGAAPYLQEAFACLTNTKQEKFLALDEVY